MLSYEISSEWEKHDKYAGKSVKNVKIRMCPYTHLILATLLVREQHERKSLLSELRHIFSFETLATVLIVESTQRGHPSSSK